MTALTPAETTVLRHVASGFTAKEIARTLELSPRTVEKHVDKFVMKLCARNRANAVAIAFQSGLLA